MTSRVAPMTDRAPAIVQDWLAAEAGSERVTLELARLLPYADLYTSFFDPAIFGGELAGRRVHTWPLQRLLGPTERFRSLLPLYPLWFSMLDLRDRDLVVSSSVAFTHAVRTSRRAVHVAYVHTPLRYAWDLDAYLSGSSVSLPGKVGARVLRPVLQRWDRAAGQRPDVLVANSETVRARIRRLWGRHAEVIHPPVDVDEIPLSQADDGFLLVAARMLAYRRLDLAVEACTRLGRELVVVGDGPERGRLEAIAGPTVRFLGRVDRAQLVDLFGRCHAYLAPGVEDFGIAPVEAMAAGKPVIGSRAGGVAETVVDGRTGILVDDPSAASLADAIERLDGLALDPAAIRARAETFGADIFRRRFVELFERLGVDAAAYVG
jgi:glycosyltransferase involved in cell wall biosynthesis